MAFDGIKVSQLGAVDPEKIDKMYMLGYLEESPRRNFRIGYQQVKEKILFDIVDQTYNPSSENAQSGKAVKEAIDGVEQKVNKEVGRLDGRIDDLDNTLTQEVERLDSKIAEEKEELEGKINEEKNKLEEKIDEVDDKYGKEVDRLDEKIEDYKYELPSHVVTGSLELTGYADINWTTPTKNNLFLGPNSNISGEGIYNGNIQVGPDTNISEIETDGNLISAQRTTIDSGEFHGNIILGNSGVINSGKLLGNTLAGCFVTVNDAQFQGPLITGHTSVVYGGKLCGNVITGEGFAIYSSCNYDFENTWIIGGLTPNSVNNFSNHNRYGLVLIGTGLDTPSADNTNRYQAYWPDSGDYPAQIHGWTQWANDCNIKDKDGEIVVQNGKLIKAGNSCPHIVICDSMNDLPPANEQDDCIIYAVLKK